MDRPYPSAAHKEIRRTLEQWLDYERDGVTTKVRGISDGEAALSPVHSGTSITGLLTHLAVVEDYWFTAGLLTGVDLPTDEQFDEAWADALKVPLETASAMYQAACDRSRGVQRELASLDQLAVHEQLSQFDYAWVLVHMIEETARHLGHLDILRELCDGATGQ
jgi:uncharacterized damage-inducible protein DinB